MSICPWDHPISGANAHRQGRYVVCRHCNRVRQRGVRRGWTLAECYERRPEWLVLDAPGDRRGRKSGMDGL